MEEISIFNYEAFYLDFLEGKLSKEKTSLLFAFLEEYPELIIDNEPLPTLHSSSFLLSKELKNDLKQYTEEDVITVTNVEHFIIASEENLLSASKKVELETLVQKEGLAAEVALYKTIHLKADYSIVYTDKDDLKHNRKIVFWPYAASIAAIFIIAILLFLPSKGVDPVFVSDNINVDTKPVARTSTPTQSSLLVINDDIQIASVYAPNNSSTSDNQTFVTDPVNSLEKKSVKPIANSIENELIPFTATENSNLNESAYSSAFNEMENPIKTITDLLSSRTNKEIDFRKTKRTSKKEKGFYLKIGKLEISRKKYR